MAYESNLAVAEGKVVRSTGDGDITVVVVTSAQPTVSHAPTKAAPPTAAKPGDKAKSSPKPDPATTPQRITVRLHLGNNLIMQ